MEQRFLGERELVFGLVELRKLGSSLLVERELGLGLLEQRLVGSCLLGRGELERCQLGSGCLGVVGLRY